MKFSKPIGIVSYGVALPTLCIQTHEIEKANNAHGVAASLGIKSKTVPDKDEDTVTLSTRALFQALERTSPEIKDEIGALFIGSESHPYAVKPSGSIVANALGLNPKLSLADLQFACKAGTQSLQITFSYLEAGLTQSAVAIGADTAQGAPGDALEYSAAAGAAAFILGTENVLAKVIASTSIATDTPDFWRRPKQSYPKHAGRFSGEPAYMTHIIDNTHQILDEVNMDIKDFDLIVFHTPNKKFPQAVAKTLNCTKEQLQHSLIVETVGNTYAAASLIAFANVLDHAGANQKILVVSYGSGSGSDAFVFETTNHLPKSRKNWTSLVSDQIAALKPIEYHQYLQHLHH